LINYRLTIRKWNFIRIVLSPAHNRRSIRNKNKY